MTKSHDRMQSHTMELPRLIEIGEKNIGDFGRFVNSLNKSKRISLISGTNVTKIIQKKIEGSLKSNRIKFVWHISGNNTITAINTIQKDVKKDQSDLIVGIGGGRSVDTAKMIAYNLDKPFVSVPTAASHDGMASPFVSIVGDKPHSIVASAPLGVFVDIDIIRKAPAKLLASGCGDLIANIIAVKDWQLGHEKTGEYYGRYSADLALMSAKIVMENSSYYAKNGLDIRVIVEALISAGVASCIAGSSRPCSGAEHLFSHALDKIAPGRGLHGEKCGIGSIMMAKLQGQDWKKIVKTLKDVGAPVSAKQVGLKSDEIITALMIAQELRPERYTILKEIEMTEKKALNLAKMTNVI
ncbi:MAG: glycerol-1-phosphate dehydrogenase [Nitrosopumilales archaeon CG15_BIG_FIL_POST_REV_8_21_14_020_33_23]|nr:MAG: glycerol-1-phosphate dehydrogenase [Nitrosopumilales archaeon CG15_BIG_FIL_POST_REV_8_21_14_020_33_23]PIY88319.1 MAG: glycerol-1-phosphate dehydrogenase [Nitrosopumilales archaeon CG_4_10_14_0_8_um_filter_34_8]PJB98371.1 MAG: glycerol-1-phosphate dehydrogenase [Nitrosopumilales archaeon CG_4_9_14_0_8_um_filter_34_10]